MVKKRQKQSPSCVDENGKRISLIGHEFNEDLVDAVWRVRMKKKGYKPELYDPKVQTALMESESPSTTKGGPGSGNFGHAGRPGKVGGSAPDRSGSGGIARGARSVRGSIIKPDPRYLNGKNKKEVMEGVEDALSAIERVHGISYYTPIEIGFFSRKKGAMAYFRSIGSAPVDIKINTAKDMDGVAADFTHEYGHYLELTILNLDLSVTNPAGLSAFKAVQRAILNSPQMKDFLLGTDPSLVADIEWRSGQKQRHDMRKEAKSYFGSFTEGFARAYMQYIAKKTGHAGMLKKVKRFSCSPGEPHIVRTMGDDILTYFVKSQWDDESFLPIEKAFDDLFDALGWSGGV